MMRTEQEIRERLYHERTCAGYLAHSKEYESDTVTLLKWVLGEES